MSILAEKKLHHCTDGRIKKEYELSEPVSRDFIAFCRNFGEMQVMDRMKKPFFTFTFARCLNIKGFIGEPSLEVWYYPEFVDVGERFLFHLFSASEMEQIPSGLNDEYSRLLLKCTQ